MMEQLFQIIHPNKWQAATLLTNILHRHNHRLTINGLGCLTLLFQCINLVQGSPVCVMWVVRLLKGKTEHIENQSERIPSHSIKQYIPVLVSKYMTYLRSRPPEIAKVFFTGLSAIRAHMEHTNAIPAVQSKHTKSSSCVSGHHYYHHPLFSSASPILIPCDDHHHHHHLT